MDYHVNGRIDYMLARYFALGFLIVALFLVMTSTTTASTTDGFQPIRHEVGDNVYIEVLPRLELLAGVQSQTSWGDRMGPKAETAAYYRRLRDFFAPYSNHAAVVKCEELLPSFNYDAPVHFILRLGPLPDLQKVRAYGSYLIGRAEGEENLDDFRAALADLAGRSDFHQFVADHRREYQGWVDSSAEDFEGEKIVNWLEQFFGKEGGSYHLVLGPGLLPAGAGFGARFPRDDGRLRVYYTATPAYDASTIFPNSRGLEKRALHEWGHSFVNPSLEPYKEKVDLLQPLYAETEELMRGQAYGTVLSFLNEYVLRAATALAFEDLYGEGAFEQEIERNVARGFYVIRDFGQLLRYYRNNRQQYATFEDFVPYLLGRLVEEVDELASIVEQKENFEYQVSRGPLWVLMGALFLTYIIVRRERVIAERKGPGEKEETPPWYLFGGKE